MPQMVQRRAEDEGFDCRVTMIAHPGWFLEQHVAEPEVRFNIFSAIMIMLSYRSMLTLLDRRINFMMQ